LGGPQPGHSLEYVVNGCSVVELGAGRGDDENARLELRFDAQGTLTEWGIWT
jgi:hypothetical protein